MDSVGLASPPTFDSLGGRLRVKGGDFWRGTRWGHVRGVCACDDVRVGPLLCPMGLRVGRRGCRAVETSTFIWVIGGASCSVLSSGSVEGCRSGVAGSQYGG